MPALEALQDAHIELMDAFQTAQSRAIGEVQRIHDETHRRAEQLAWRSRLSLVGSAGLVAVAVIFGFAQPSPPPVIVMPSDAPAGSRVMTNFGGSHITASTCSPFFCICRA